MSAPPLSVGAVHVSVMWVLSMSDISGTPGAPGASVEENNKAFFLFTYSLQSVLDQTKVNVYGTGQNFLKI